MIGRVVDSADFERLLGTRPRSRSAHFAVHHVGAAPARPRPWVPAASAPQLSTGRAPDVPELVDNVPVAVAGHWLGTLVPKRHARRAVTRSLLKRQMRAAVLRHAARLPAGLWLVRLREPFDRARFPSAASDALRRCAGAELEALLQRATA